MESNASQAADQINVCSVQVELNLCLHQDSGCRGVKYYTSIWPEDCLIGMKASHRLCLLSGELVIVISSGPLSDGVSGCAEFPLDSSEAVVAPCDT